jgi:predicted ATPase/class 3 adenylate cyclase
VDDRMGQQPEYAVEAGQKLTSNLPTGTVTLLFTDIEKSTQLLRQLGEQYTFVLETSRRLLRAAFQQWNGHEVDMQGDAFFVAFARASDAVAAAVTAQRLLYTHHWPEGVAVRVRMGLHTGEPQHSSESYVGLDVHYAARLTNAAHGGQVLLSRTTRELVEHDLPEGVSLLDLGLYHLKDIPGPKSIFQLVIPDLSAVFPPPNALDTRFHNLPVQLTSLIGREQEIAALCALLQRTDVRLVTLTGTGGIGKTRLGLQVATDLLGTFVDGVYFVPLAPVSNPTTVISTIAQWLGLERRRTGQLPRLDQEHMEYLQTFLRDKHVLLLLDNFEQVVTAAPDLVDLLAACPYLKILVTSRAVLHLSGEYEFGVPPLALPERTHLGVNEDLAQYAAVALFLERALAIKPDLPLTKANLRAIAAICLHLDGLPLALELAAARIKLLPPRALLQRLTHRLTVLTGGTQDVPARQQTLRNTITWSYDLLDEAEQQLFRRISVFVGGCTLEAIETIAGAFVAGTASILDGVTSLIDKSLLQQTEQEEEEPRLIMLETIREYGLEALSAHGEEEVTRQAHAAYYLALAEMAEPHYGGPEQTVWLGRLEREHDNLRAALLWSLEQAETEEARPRIEIALRLGGALRRFWLVHAHVTEGRNFLEQALAASEKTTAPVRAKALIATANLAVAQNDYERTEVLTQQSLTLFRELGDQPGIAFSLQLLGSALWNRGNPAAGRSLTEEALTLFRKIGDKSQTAWALTQLALLDSSQGQYSRAYTLFEEGLALHRESIRGA